MNTPEWLKTAKVGDNLVALRDDGFVTKGQVYKISGIRIVENEEFYGVSLRNIIYSGVLITLENKRFTSSGIKISFDPQYFKPVEPVKTDITLFHNILKNPSSKIREDA